MAAGFDEQGAAALLDVVPRSLEPSVEGVELLYAMRREMGLLPEGAPAAEDLFLEARA